MKHTCLHCTTGSLGTAWVPLSSPQTSPGPSACQKQLQSSTCYSFISALTALYGRSALCCFPKCRQPEHRLLLPHSCVFVGLRSWLREIHQHTGCLSHGSLESSPLQPMSATVPQTEKEFSCPRAFALAAYSCPPRKHSYSSNILNVTTSG